MNRYEEYNLEEDGDGGVEQLSFTNAVVDPQPFNISENRPSSREKNTLK